MFTRGSAWAAGDETRLGALLPGFHADFQVLETDPLTVPPESLSTLCPAATVVGGEVVSGAIAAAFQGGRDDRSAAVQECCQIEDERV